MARKEVPGTRAGNDRAMSIHPTAQVHPTAIIGPNVTIGANVYVGPYAVIGMHAESHEVDVMQPVNGSVTIGADCIIHELTTIQASRTSEGVTAIGVGCRIQAHAHVGHDANLGYHVTIACGAKIGGHREIGDWSNIGLNAVLHQRACLGEGVMVGASAFVKGTLGPWGIFVGVPAKYIGPNKVGLMHKEKREEEERQRSTAI